MTILITMHALPQDRQGNLALLNSMENYKMRNRYAIGAFRPNGARTDCIAVFYVEILFFKIQMKRRNCFSNP